MFAYAYLSGTRKIVKVYIIPLSIYIVRSMLSLHTSSVATDNYSQFLDDQRKLDMLRHWILDYIWSQLQIDHFLALSTILMIGEESALCMTSTVSIRPLWCYRTSDTILQTRKKGLILETIDSIMLWMTCKMLNDGFAAGRCLNYFTNWLSWHWNPAWYPDSASFILCSAYLLQVSFALTTSVRCHTNCSNGWQTLKWKMGKSIFLHVFWIGYGYDLWRRFARTIERRISCCTTCGQNHNNTSLDTLSPGGVSIISITKQIAFVHMSDFCMTPFPILSWHCFVCQRATYIQHLWIGCLRNFGVWLYILQL